MLPLVVLGVVSGSVGWWYSKRVKVADIYKLYENKISEITSIPKPIQFFSHVCSYESNKVLPSGKATDDLRKYPYTAYVFIHKEKKCVIVKHPDLLWNGYIEHGDEKIRIKCYDENIEIFPESLEKTLTRYWTFEMSYHHLVDKIDEIHGAS